MAVNADGFYNTVVGHGMRNFDPFKAYRYNGGGEVMTDQELDTLFTHNGIAQKIITAPANEAVRAGMRLKGDDEADIDANEAVQSVLEDLDAWHILAEALSWNRLFGGAVVLMVCDDGGELNEPLRLESLKSIKKLLVFEPPEVQVHESTYLDDMHSPDFGRPEYYTLIGYSGNSFLVHASRLLVMRGETVSNRVRRARDGWGGRVFDRVREDVLHYDTGLSLSLLLLSRLSQSVLKLDGLTELMQTDFGEQAVQKRLQLLDMSRHLMNTIALDTADDYDQKNVTIAGVQQILEQFQYALCASTDIPATVLFGRSPAGENATGKSDQENYYAMISRIQQRTLRPQLVKLVELIGACRDYNISLPPTWTIAFNPLWIPSKMDEAQVANTKAQAIGGIAGAAKVLHDLGALDVSEIRAKLKVDDTFDIDDSLDAVIEGAGNADNTI